MQWDEAVRCTLAPAAAALVIADMRRRWAGVHIYIPRRTTRRTAGATGGASVRFAHDLYAAVHDVGGTAADARVILAAIAGQKNYIR